MTRPPGSRPRQPPRYRLRRTLGVVLGVLVLLGGLAVATRFLIHDAGLADVEQVEVTGARTVGVPAVLAAAAVPVGDALASVDTAAAARRVAALPGVASVRVGQEWPHTVTIEVTERVPVAVTDTADGRFLLDATGLPYRAAPAGTGRLPRLTGSASPGDPATTAGIAVLTALPESVRAQVLTVGVSGTGRVTLGLTDARRVRWGSVARSPEKVAVLVPLLTRPGAVYDVASPDLPTVRS